MADVARDPEWVQREYGRDKWPAIAERIREHDDPLPQALSRVSAPPNVVQRAMFDGQIVEIPASMASAAYRGWLARTVADHAEGAEAVVELGAGWGANLFGSYLAGGPQDAHYVAAEYTDAGRRAAELLAARAPELSFAAAAFDFHHPTWELPTFERATVFTAHAIEQVPHLPASFLPFVASLAEEVTVLHFEPIGWQTRGEDSQYAERHDYNRNLWPLLRGAVEIVELDVDIVGVNAANPTTLAIWRPAG